MILITGSTGGLGSAILSAFDGVAGPSSAEGGTADVGTGTEVQGSSRRAGGGDRVIDFDRPQTVDFTGVHTLVLVSAGEAEDDVVIARHETAIAAAERDGVAHVVYTSVTTAGDHLGFALAHRHTEDRLRRSPMSFTILRNGLYAELLGSLLVWSPTGERVFSAFGDGALSAVGRADLAEAAARVAASAELHAGRTYDLVARPITAAEVAASIGVELVEETLEARRAQLLGLAGQGAAGAAGAEPAPSGLKPFQPPMLMSIYSAVRHGFLAGTSGDLELLLGRPASPTVPIASGALLASRP